MHPGIGSREFPALADSGVASESCRFQARLSRQSFYVAQTGDTRTEPVAGETIGVKGGFILGAKRPRLGGAS
jgi:hypothetical protein